MRLRTFCTLEDKTYREIWVPIERSHATIQDIIKKFNMIMDLKNEMNDDSFTSEI